MAISFQQAPVSNTATSTTITATYGSAVTPGNLLVAAVKSVSASGIVGVSDSVNGAWTLDATAPTNVDVTYTVKFFSFPSTSLGTPIVTLTLSANDDGAITIYELAGAATSSVVDASNGSSPSPASSTTPSTTLTTGTANCCILAAMAAFSADWAVTAGANLTTVQSSAAGSGFHYDARWLDTSTAGSKVVAFTLASGSSGPYVTMVAVAYKASGGAGPSSFSKPMWPMSFF